MRVGGFGRRLREMRDVRGLSQAQLGRRLDIAQSGVSMWERGVRVPDAVQLLALADVLDCSVDWLLRGSERDPGDDDDAVVRPVVPGEVVALRRHLIALNQRYDRCAERLRVARNELDALQNEREANA